MSATSKVVAAVFDMLRTGRYRLGDRLPSEWDLVEQLGVGRSAVREAVRELAALGVADVQPGRGTFVRALRPDLLVQPDALSAEVDRALAREYLEVRLVLEPDAAALAAVRAGRVDLERLAHDVERLAEAVDVGYRPPEDLGFHIDIARATNNTALSRFSGAIVSYYLRDDSLPTIRDVEEHRAVFEAIRDRNPVAARAAMRSHLASEVGIRGLARMMVEWEAGQQPDRRSED